MPVIESTYTSKGIFRNRHLSTIYSAKLRRVSGVSQNRERVVLTDGDFIDIDWSYAHKHDHQIHKQNHTTKVALLFHGLEGDAQRTYMLGMAKLLNQNHYDVAAINFRGCSGEQNKRYRSYHSGETDDIRFIVKKIHDVALYDTIVLYGVSLGGNAVLKYLGEKKEIPPSVKAASTIGVPSDLKASLDQLNLRENWIYRTSFLLNLRKKYRKKLKLYPHHMSIDDYRKIKSLKDFDDLYTAPAHGFKDALDYYQNASSYSYLPDIAIPTLILNAKNDSFLHGDCYPYAFAKASKFLFLETPQYGGHVGFYLPGDFYYNEKRTLEFFNEKLA